MTIASFSSAKKMAYGNCGVRARRMSGRTSTKHADVRRCARWCAQSLRGRREPQRATFRGTTLRLPRVLRAPRSGRQFAISLRAEDFTIHRSPGFAGAWIVPVRFEACLKLACELIRDRQERRVLKDRVPDLADELKPLGNRQFADLGDVSHGVILRLSPARLTVLSLTGGHRTPVRIALATKAWRWASGSAALGGGLGMLTTRNAEKSPVEVLVPKRVAQTPAPRATPGS